VGPGQLGVHGRFRVQCRGRVEVIHQCRHSLRFMHDVYQPGHYWRDMSQSGVPDRGLPGDLQKPNNPRGGLQGGGGGREGSCQR